MTQQHPRQVQLYQVQVTTADKRDIFVGPVVNEPRVLEPFVEAINVSVAQNKQRDWRDARVVKVEVVEQ